MEGSKQSALNDYARNIIHHKARQLIGKYGFTRSDYEDLKQEMVLDLLMRLPKFDPGRSRLNTFVSRVIDRKISTIIRYRQQKKRDYRREACSLDDPLDDEGCSCATRGELVSQDDQHRGRYSRTAAERLDLRLDLLLAIEDLSPELKRLAELLLTHTITEAADELGVPRSTLYERGIARLRKAFEDKGLREYL